MTHPWPLYKLDIGMNPRFTGTCPTSLSEKWTYSLDYPTEAKPIILRYGAGPLAADYVIVPARTKAYSIAAVTGSLNWETVHSTDGFDSGPYDFEFVSAVKTTNAAFNDSTNRFFYWYLAKYQIWCQYPDDSYHWVTFNGYSSPTINAETGALISTNASPFLGRLGSIFSSMGDHIHIGGIPQDASNLDELIFNTDIAYGGGYSLSNFTQKIGLINYSTSIPYWAYYVNNAKFNNQTDSTFPTEYSIPSEPFNGFCFAATKTWRTEWYFQNGLDTIRFRGSQYTGGSPYNAFACDTYDSRNSQPIKGFDSVWNGLSYVDEERCYVPASNNKIIQTEASGMQLWADLSDDISGAIKRGIAFYSYSKEVEKPGGNPGETVTRNMPVLIYTESGGKLGSYDGYDLVTGRNWTVPIGANPGDPVLHNDGILVPVGNKVYAYDYNGIYQSEYNAGDTVNGLAITTDGLIVGTTAGGKVFCLQETSTVFNVVTTDPLDNASGVARDKEIVIEFSSGLDDSTITTDSLKVLNGVTELEYVFELVDDKYLHINPNNPELWPTSAHLDVVLSTAVFGENGAHLPDEYTFDFDTDHTHFDINLFDEFELFTDECVSEKTFIEFRAPIADDSPWVVDWLVHYRVQTYKDAGKVSLIEAKNTEDNAADFYYSTDEGNSWSAFPAGGLERQYWGSRIKVQMNTGLKEIVYIQFGAGADPV